jgi:hypothetical protein
MIYGGGRFHSVIIATQSALTDAAATQIFSSGLSFKPDHQGVLVTASTKAEDSMGRGVQQSCI